MFERRSRCYAIDNFERHRVHPAFGRVSPRCQPPTRFERTCRDVEFFPRKPVSNRSLRQHPQQIPKETSRFSDDTSSRGEFTGVCFAVLRKVPSLASYVPNVVLRHHQWHIHQSLEKGALTSPVVFSVLSFAILSHFGKRIKDHMEKRV